MTDHSPVLRQHGYHSLRVARVVRETADASSFVLDVPAELSETFRYRPGQFCTFRVRVDGVEQLRSYSMSSAPGRGRRPDGHRQARAGRGGLQLAARQPGSGATCSSSPSRRASSAPRSPGARCWASAAAAASPRCCRSPSTCSRRRRAPSTFCTPTATAQSVIFADALAGLVRRHPERLEVHHHLDADRGFLTAGDIEAFAADHLDADCYICGPGPFMDLVEPALPEPRHRPGPHLH